MNHFFINHLFIHTIQIYLGLCCLRSTCSSASSLLAALVSPALKAAPPDRRLRGLTLRGPTGVCSSFLPPLILNTSMSFLLSSNKTKSSQITQTSKTVSTSIATASAMYTSECFSIASISVFTFNASSFFVFSNYRSFFLCSSNSFSVKSLNIYPLHYLLLLKVLIMSYIMT